jgi:hypothetical protein
VPRLYDFNRSCGAFIPSPRDHKAIANWSHVTPSRFTIPAHTETFVHLTVDVPKGYYGGSQLVYGLSIPDYAH